MGLISIGAWGSPLPASPTRGEVWGGEWGKTVPDTPAGTSPLVGEVGRGVPTALRLGVSPQ